MKHKIAIHSSAKKKSLPATSGAALMVLLEVSLLTTQCAMAQAENGLHPDTEAALRHQIESMEKGQPDFDMMVPSLAARARSSNAEVNIQRWGALKSITFREKNNGNDVYQVEFENQLTAWTIGPLQPGGKVGPTLSFATAIRRDGNSPSPGTKAALRRLLDARYWRNILLFYDLLGPDLAARAHRLPLGEYPEMFQVLGTVKSVSFSKVDAMGFDEYQAIYKHGRTTWLIAPLVDGKVEKLIPSDIFLDASSH